jgi:hypothetical protein
MIKELYFIFGKYSHIWLNLSKDDCDLHFSYKQILKNKNTIFQISASAIFLGAKFHNLDKERRPLKQVQRLILEKNWPTLMRNVFKKSPYLDKRL